MAFVEDMSVFFADFGASASIAGDDPVAVLFDEAFVSPLGIAGAQPVLTLSTSVYRASRATSGSVVMVDDKAAPGGPLGVDAVRYVIRVVVWRIFLERDRHQLSCFGLGASPARSICARVRPCVSRAAAAIGANTWSMLRFMPVALPRWPQ